MTEAGGGSVEGESEEREREVKRGAHWGDSSL